MTPKNEKARAEHRRGAGRPSVEEAAIRIERLLDVATEVFVEKGYLGATVGEIARRAHASKQTLYSRYPTKADLFSAVMYRYCEGGFVMLADILHPDKTLSEALTGYADIVIIPMINVDAIRMHRTIISTAETFPGICKRFWEIGPARAEKMFVEFIVDRMKKGELRKDDPDEAARLFTAMCSGRYWSLGLFGIRPRVKKAETEEYRDRIVRSFLLLYEPTG